MKKVIVYGNCHTGILIDYLERSRDFRNKYEIIHIPQIQEIYNAGNKSSIHDVCFESCDVFIHQSIQKNNRYGEEYASERIIKRLKKDCIVIAIPNLYGLPICVFPQCVLNQSLYLFGEVFFFRDRLIEKLVNEKRNIEDICVAYQEDMSVFPEEDLVMGREQFLDKVKRREEDWDVKIYDYIKRNMDKRLFYDPNHPTNLLLEHVIEELCKKLGVSIDLAAVRRNVYRALDTYEMPLCAPVAKLYGVKNQGLRESYGGRKIGLRAMTIKQYVECYIAALWENNELVGPFASEGKRIYYVLSVRRLISLPIKKCINLFYAVNRRLWLAM